MIVRITSQRGWYLIMKYKISDKCLLWNPMFTQMIDKRRSYLINQIIVTWLLHHMSYNHTKMQGSVQAGICIQNMFAAKTQFQLSTCDNNFWDHSRWVIHKSLSRCVYVWMLCASVILINLKYSSRGHTFLRTTTVENQRITSRILPENISLIGRF